MPTRAGANEAGENGEAVPSRFHGSGPALPFEGNYSFALTLLSRVASRMVGGVSVRGWNREHRVAWRQTLSVMESPEGLTQKL